LEKSVDSFSVYVEYSENDEGTAMRLMQSDLGDVVAAIGAARPLGVTAAFVDLGVESLARTRCGASRA
jgi:hypothetical protein